MCTGVARPESAAGSSPGAVTSTAGCAASQLVSTLSALGFAPQHGAFQAPSQHASGLSKALASQLVSLCRCVASPCRAREPTVCSDQVLRSWLGHGTSC